MAIHLTPAQATFLKIAKEMKEQTSHYNPRGLWFNRKDIYSEHMNFMPYATGLTLFRMKLLETSPPGHPAGYDLNFRITELGETILNEGQK